MGDWPKPSGSRTAAINASALPLRPMKIRSRWRYLCFILSLPGLISWSLLWTDHPVSGLEPPASTCLPNPYWEVPPDPWHLAIGTTLIYTLTNQSDCRQTLDIAVSSNSGQVYHWHPQRVVLSEKTRTRLQVYSVFIVGGGLITETVYLTATVAEAPNLQIHAQHTYIYQSGASPELNLVYLPLIRHHP